MDDAEFEYAEYEDERDGQAFSGGRLLGVAMVGAFVSLSVYYVYQQLDPDKRAKLKKQASGLIADQIHTLTEVRDD